MPEASENRLLDIAQVCEKAAAAIDERGWCQDYLEDTEGRVCALGGIQVAVYGHTNEATVWRASPLYPELTDDEQMAHDTMVALIGTVWGEDLPENHRGYAVFGNEDPGLITTMWNDQAGRVIEDVTGALRDTAARLYKEASK